MVNFTILAGGFAVPGFIATYVFNNETSHLALVETSPTGDNPSWIASHPQNSSILYAVNEVQTIGSLQSFTVQSNGSVSLVDTVSTGGIGPTFTNPLSTGEVSGMNFGSPNCSFVATQPDNPLQFETDSPVVAFPVPEGAKSNPHMSLEYNGEIFVPDLGGDKIWRIVNDGAPGKFKVQGQINIDPGTGPRHIAIYNNILFTVHETVSTLTAQPIPEAPNGTTLPLIANVTTFPDNAPAGAKFAAAEILISTPTDKFPNPIIYVSNRNIGDVVDPSGDTIAVFEFQNTTSTSSSGSAQVSSTCLTNANAKRMKRARKHVGVSDYLRRDSQEGGFSLLAQVPTGLQQIRSMALGKVEDGSDEFIVAGANTVGGVAILQRVDGGRNLTLVASDTRVDNRTSFVFVPGLL